MSKLACMVSVPGFLVLLLPVYWGFETFMTKRYEFSYHGFSLNMYLYKAFASIYTTQCLGISSSFFVQMLRGLYVLKLSQSFCEIKPRRDVKRFCTMSRYAYLCMYAILCCEHCLLSPSDTLLINMYTHCWTISQYIHSKLLFVLISCRKAMI